MLLRSRRMICGFARVAFALSIVAANACSSDEVATSGTLSVGELTTTGITSTADPPTTTDPPTTSDPIVFDDVPCTPAAAAVCETGMPRSCCDERLPESICPGVYPHAWTCPAGYCVLGGCTDHVQCIVPGLKCLEVGSVYRCVTPCTSAAQCKSDLHMDGTNCNAWVDNNSTKYCSEAP